MKFLPESKISDKEKLLAAKLYVEWDLRCFTLESFTSWVNAYIQAPDRDDVTQEAAPINLHAYCTDADRNQCLLERAVGKCRWSQEDFYKLWESEYNKDGAP